MLPKLENCSVGIIGLGYVGLPLALEIAKQKTCLLTKGKLERTVFGYDIDKNRKRLSLYPKKINRQRGN